MAPTSAASPTRRRLMAAWDGRNISCANAVYLPDQVSRARSGFDPTVFNRVHSGAAIAGRAAPHLALQQRARLDSVPLSSTFGVPYPDEQFPVEAMDELAKQMVPDLNGMLPEPNPTHKALSDLDLSLKGAVLMGHS